MKRIICLALCALMAILVCACDDSSVGSTADTAATAAAVATADKATETVKPAAQKSGRVGLKDFIKRFNTTVTAEEKIVYKDADFEVKLLGIDYSSASGPALKLSFKNNFGKDITIQAPYAVVNGYMITPDMSVEVPYAKSGAGSLSLPYYYLSMAGITTLREIEFSLRVVDSKSYNPIFKTDMISVKTSAADTEEPECDESGQVVYDDNDVKIVIKGITATHVTSDGSELVVYMYNGTDKTIAVQTDDVKVNGCDMTSVMNRTILPGKRAVDAVVFYAQDLDEQDIDEIDSVKVSFQIKDADTRETIDSTDLISVELKVPETAAPETKASESAASESADNTKTTEKE